MNTQDKSLALAYLMGWAKDDDKGIPWYTSKLNIGTIAPYEDDRDGLAQFAAILLKFSEVMSEIHKNCEALENNITYVDQEYILDCILRMNGVEP